MDPALKRPDTPESPGPRVEKPETFSPRLASIVFGVHVVAIAGAWYFYSAEGLLALAASHWFFSTFGVAFGYHRLFSHKSFVPSAPFRKFLGVVSTLCFQGGPIFWACAHRVHHQRTEMFGDPYSAARGFFWSHIGWMLHNRPNGFSYGRAQKTVPDLLEDKFLVFLETNAVLINVVVMIVAAVAFGLAGRIDLFFWTFPVRIMTVWHATWMTNSFYHGASFSKGQPPTGLRNNVLGDILLGGEGSHKNHHERPALFSNSRKWYQLDFAAMLMPILRLTGLVKSIRGRR